MINARVWRTLKPSVGIPVFLSAVAVGSFLVHLASLISSA
jgi:light-harvesting protein B-800-850 alpha chain